MSDALLKDIGEGLGNISAAIAEHLRQSGQGATPPPGGVLAPFDQEILRLQSAGQDGVAGSLSTLRGTLSRLISEGW